MIRFPGKCWETPVNCTPTKLTDWDYCARNISLHTTYEYMPSHIRHYLYIVDKPSNYSRTVRTFHENTTKFINSLYLMIRIVKICINRVYTCPLTRMTDCDYCARNIRLHTSKRTCLVTLCRTYMYLCNIKNKLCTQFIIDINLKQFIRFGLIQWLFAYYFNG